MLLIGSVNKVDMLQITMSHYTTQNYQRLQMKGFMPTPQGAVAKMNWEVMKITRMVEPSNSGQFAAIFANV